MKLNHMGAVSYYRFGGGPWPTRSGILATNATKNEMPG